MGGIINGFLGAIRGEHVRNIFYNIQLTCLGHESLFKFGARHRDISVGNIVLTENEDDGFLIDFDLSMRISNDRASSAPSKTGTKIFMAIGALLGEPHSFMHDLESFFWVLFWICIHSDGRNEKSEVKRRIVSKYERWNYVDTEDLADLKKGLIVEDDVFDKTVAGFTPGYKSLIPCIQELRKYIVPNGKRYVGREQRLIFSDEDCI